MQQVVPHHNYMTVIPSNCEQSRIIAPSQVIGTRAVAAMLGVTAATVTRRVKAGTLPVLAQLDGRQGALVFDRADIEAITA